MACHCSGGLVTSISTLTRCSSMPSADTLVNAAGSTRPHPSFHRRAAPALDHHAPARLGLHRVGGEQLAQHFHLARIADVEQGGAGRQGGLARLGHLQHDAGHRGADLQRPRLGIGRAGRTQHGGRLLLLVHGDVVFGDRDTSSSRWAAARARRVRVEPGRREGTPRRPASRCAALPAWASCTAIRARAMRAAARSTLAEARLQPGLRLARCCARRPSTT